MGMPKTPKPPHTGHGELTVARQIYPVAFSLQYFDGGRGQRAAKGCVTGAPEAMRQAFRQGRVQLRLDDGKAFDISIVAHAEGSPTAYFESAGDLR